MLMNMQKKIKYLLVLGFALWVAVVACKKTEYSFGKIKTPSGLAISTVIQGADNAHPTGDGSGVVTITATAADALAYKIYFGNGDSVLSSSGTVKYKYTLLDTNSFTITVNAIGTAGVMSTSSKQIKVLYLFQIPADILADLTNGSSRSWMIHKDTTGHFGVGPIASFSPDWYKAGPNEKPSCAYDDVVTFTKTGANSITMTVDNKGQSFLIGAATAFYGAGGGDGCYAIGTGGARLLGFAASNSGSNASNSTGVQFTVPGNGIVDFGTGGSTYEILSITPGIISLRNVGIDGNAWYQILKAQ
jgi:hypothetical protein